VSIKKHIVLKEWTEWENMPTGGIVTSTTTMTNANDKMEININLLNQIDNIVWTVTNSLGNDVSTLFRIENGHSLTNVYLINNWSSSYPELITFIAINNGLQSNAIHITLIPPSSSIK
jgi:hypothetical protein